MKDPYIIKFLKTELNQNLCQLTVEMSFLLLAQGGQVDCGQWRTLDILSNCEQKACQITVSKSIAKKAWYLSRVLAAVLGKCGIGASLLDYIKLKKETEPYVARGLIYTVARSSITQRSAYVWRAVAP